MIPLDGNGAAGVLQEVFSLEMTSAMCRCESCREVSAVGGLLLYGGSMGAVLRCPSCEAVVLRITQSRNGWVIEAHAILHIRSDQPA